MGTEHDSLLRRRSSLRHAHTRGFALRSEVGLRPSFFYSAECRSRWRLAWVSRCHHEVPAKHADRLCPRVQARGSVICALLSLLLAAAMTVTSALGLQL